MFGATLRFGKSVEIRYADRTEHGDCGVVDGRRPLFDICLLLVNGQLKTGRIGLLKIRF